MSEAIEAFDWRRCLHTPVSTWFSVFKAKWGNSLPPSKHQLLPQPGKTSVNSYCHTVWWCSPLSCCIWYAHIDFYLPLWLNFNQRIFYTISQESEKNQSPTSTFSKYIFIWRWKNGSSVRALFLHASHNGTVILPSPAVFATTVQRYQETTLNNQDIFNHGNES